MTLEPRRILLHANWFTIGIALELIALAPIIAWTVTH
jgi:hypothetical protein